MAKSRAIHLDDMPQPKSGLVPDSDVRLTETLGFRALAKISVGQVSGPSRQDAGKLDIFLQDISNLKGD